MVGMKEQYVGEVRDEAADFVGSDGKSAAGAALKEAIKDVRAQDDKAQDKSDLEISKLILSAKN